LSEQEIQDIEHILSELQIRILAKITRWALITIGTIVLISVTGAAKWLSLEYEIEKLKTWRSERTGLTNDFYNARMVDSERLTKLEARVDEILRILKSEDHSK